jgi:hypothetical protein
MRAARSGQARDDHRNQRGEHMTDHTGRVPGADHLPGQKGLEEEIRDANKDDPELSQEPRDADEVDERELATDPEPRDT